MFNIEVSYTYINTIWVIIPIWFVYNLFSNNKFISSIEKVFFACILKIYRFYQFIINLVQIGAFMFFPQIINNSKNTVINNGKIQICHETCCRSNCFKINNVSDWGLCNLYRLCRCGRDYKTISIKVIKYYRKQWRSKAVSSRICKTANKRWQRFLNY